MIKFLTRTIYLLTTVLCLSANADSTSEQKAIYIDVRSAQEFADDHLDGAINIPHTVIASEIGDLKLAKDTEIFLYCRSGRRAGLALEELKALGFTRVVNLKTLAASRTHAQKVLE